MINRDLGVILNTGKSGETSLHVTFLGRDSGKVKLLAKGARSAKSPHRAVLQAGHIIEAMYYFKPNRSLYFLKDAELVFGSFGEPDTLESKAARLAVLELLSGVCPWGSADAAVVDLYRSFCEGTDAADPVLMFLAFEVKLLRVLGVAPDMLRCEGCGEPPVGGTFDPATGFCFCATHAANAGTHAISLGGDSVKIFGRLASEPFTTLAGETVEPATRKRCGRILHATYTFHIQGYQLPQALQLIRRQT